MVGDAMLVTVRVAVLLAVPIVVCVVVTPDVVLGLPPTVLLVTLNVTVQLPDGIAIPVKLSAAAPALNVAGVVPAQVPPTAPPTALMLASVSENAPPVRAEALLFDSVRVTTELPPDAIEVGLNPLAIVGAANTVRVALLLAVPVGVCVVVTPDVLLGWTPAVLLVTLNVTVQLLLAGIVIPVKLSAVAPALKEEGVVPAQVPPTAPPTALMLASVSVNAPAVRAEALLLDRVSVTTELPPDAIEVGLNPLAMVGAANTVRLALLLAVPVGVCVVVTPDVLLGRTPAVLLVTLKVTVQLLPDGIAIPVKLRAVAPALKEEGVVPVQVPPTAPPTALMLASVSVNAPPVRAEALLLDRVSVTTELPPD